MLVASSAWSVSARSVVIFMLCVIFALIPFDGAVRLFFGVPYLSLAIDFLAITCIFLAILKGRLSEVGGLVAVFLMCCVVLVFSFFNNEFKTLYMSLSSFRLTGLYCFMFIVPVFVRFDDGSLFTIYRVVLLLGMVAGANAIRQWIYPFGAEIEFANAAGGAAKFYGDYFQGGINDFRVFSFFITSVHLVMFLALVLFLALAAHLTSYRSGYFEKVAILLSSIGILLTFSRTGWLSILAGLMVIMPLVLSQAHRIRNITIILLVSVMLFFYVMTNELLLSRILSLADLDGVSSFNSRIYLWADRLDKIFSNPFGYGVGAAGWNAHDEMALGADSNYLKFYLELGWFGGSVFIMLLLCILARFLRVYPAVFLRTGMPSIGRVFVIAIFCYFVSVLIGMVTNQLLEAFPVNFMFWLFLGVGCVLCKKYRS